ncbi:MAG: hypothetical protein TREMPRED_003093 [Tremellales sp. Tagirdzhanova-0007]|nr:MAG: hypothetical protein TREMPRED_003093 [Tremellales sp. Tagirdzhanova-0007]
MSHLSPFQRHLLFFATRDPIPRLTLLSALRASLRLGMNLPVAILASLSIRILYAPFPFLRPMAVSSVPRQNFRTQLEAARLDRSGYTKDQLVALCDGDSALNKAHVGTLWTLVADVKTGLVDVEDVRRFQGGDWAEEVVKRRKSRVPGRGEVLPFMRGGPLIVSAHSWAAYWLFGIDVYGT